MQARGARRCLYLTLGGFFFVLAVLGAFLPLLPATPFLLLSSYFFVRSSPALHRKLLRSRRFGPLLNDWDRYRAVRPRIKKVSLVMMTSAVGASVYFGNFGPLGLGALLTLGVVGFVVVMRLRVIEEEE
ncbi:MAG TPA: YbaN family protein [Bryobacterales bacterium]|nr:YbaN family protein [Bryobacterales bacterium]